MTAVFTMSEHWWIYLTFVGIVFALLALDLGVFHKKAHVVGFREASIWSVVWITLSVLFGFGLSALAPEEHSKRVLLEYLTGFVIEKTLAVDNIFIFVVIFSFFRIPRELQHRVLFYGILGALIFRAIFIALGAYLMQFMWVHYVFGAFLILTGVKMFFKTEENENPGDNKFFRWLQARIPMTNKLHGESFWVKDGTRWVATPLFLALLVLEFSDIIFAIDSVPAIFAITKDPLIVFTSNIFAILGLRSLYFMLAGVVDKFHLLRYGLAAVLVFVGLKMAWLNHAFGGKFPISWSLSIIAVSILASIAASLYWPKKETSVAP